MMVAIEAQNTVKQYKNGVQALNGLNISVKEGEIFSLLGQNGAGKSTLIKILTTYLKPTSGNVTMLGKDIDKQEGEVRREIACVSQQTSIDTHLSLEENMMFQSSLYKIPKAEAKKKMEILIADFGLEQYRKYPVSSYSGGVKRRLDIALNMMSNPKILFLDEPTTQMDIQSLMSMWEMMRKIRDDFGTTIFLTTHYLEEADNLSNTVCIMKDGKEVIQGTPLELRSFIRQDSHFDMKKVIRFLLEQHIPFDGIQIVQPMLWLVLYSAVAGQTMQNTGIENYTAFILPGLMVLVSFGTCSSGGIMNYLMKADGSFYRVLIAPIHRSSIVLGQLLEAVLCSFLEVGIMVMVSLFFFVKIPISFSVVFYTVILVFLLSFFMAGLCYGVSLVLPNEVMYETVMNAIVLPVFFLSTALFPANNITGALGVAINLNPFTHVINALRSLILYGHILDYKENPLDMILHFY